MARRISQESFNDVVKENIEMFDMSISEAIEDAKKQFQTQNVDLFNIITDACMFDLIDGEIIIKIHPVLLKLNEIKNILINGNSDEIDPLTLELTEYFQKDVSYRVTASKNEGFEILEKYLKETITKENEAFSINSISVFYYLVNGQPDIITLPFLDYIVQLLKSEDVSAIIKCHLFKLLNFSCVKHEGNRTRLVDEPNCIIQLSASTIEKYGLVCRDIVREICSFCRVLITDDDIRVTCGHGTEYARIFVAETPFLDILLKLCKEYKERDDEMIVAEIFSTLDKLSVRDEFCQRILDLGGLRYLLDSLNNHIKVSRIVVASFGLLKSIAANDLVKVEIGRQDGLELIIQALLIHIRNANACINGFGALAAITLRQPENCKLLVQLGVVTLLKQCLIIHTDLKHYEILRAACLTIRNLVARTPELKTEIIESGFEELLNEVLKLGRNCDDEAKAALRDLGLAVVLRELWTGKSQMKMIYD